MTSGLPSLHLIYPRPAKPHKTNFSLNDKSHTGKLRNDKQRMTTIGHKLQGKTITQHEKRKQKNIRRQTAQNQLFSQDN